MVLRRLWLFICFSIVLLSCDTNPPINADGSPDSARLYTIHCASCHKSDGTGGIAGAKNLRESLLSIGELAQVISKGRGDMMPFESILDENEVAAVSTYVKELKYKN